MKHGAAHSFGSLSCVGDERMRRDRTGCSVQVVTELSLVSGWFPAAVTVASAVGALWLVVVASRHHILVVVPAAIAGAAALTAGGSVVVEKWWRPFPDPIETPIYVWIAVAVAALILLVPRLLLARRWWTRVLTVLAAVAVVLGSTLHVNLVFGAYPTLGTVFGVSGEDEIALPDLPGWVPDPITGIPLDSAWSPPDGMATGGRVTTGSIPDTASGFTARDAVVYLPPAYFTDRRPLLPVLVLLAGQPGAPDDWLTGGRLSATMDRFADEHAGLAPIVVVADGTGSEVANPLCVDSPLGNVSTYLATDVPNWVKSTLQVDTDPRHWAIGGLSYGGTCSLQMATNHPEVYPTFLDLSGQLEPTLGDTQRTLDAAFGGSGSAFAAVNPVDLMKTRRFPDTAGAFVVGADDNDYRPGVQTLYSAAQAAGMDVRYLEVPGGHSFEVWSAGLDRQLDWLATRLGLIS